MKTRLSNTLPLLLAAILLNDIKTMAQNETLPRPDAPIKIIKPDRAVIERIRAEFERLPTKLGVIYDSKQDDQVGGFSIFAPPKYLSITLAGPAAQFIKGKGLRETDLRCEPIFALVPYLGTDREKEAFVILMALTREFYAHKTPLSPMLPYGKNFDLQAWEAGKSELITKLRTACAFCLEFGAETGWRRKYDLGDLALEKLPSSTTAKPSAEPVDLSPASGTSTSKLPLVQSHQPRKPDQEQSGTTEEPTTSTPWSVVTVLVVAATGLLWLLVKNRK